MKKYKKADKYVTFIPFEEETLLFVDNGPIFITTNKELLEYDAKVRVHEGQIYYQYTADTPEKLKLFTNAYDFYYQAIYQGIKFRAGVSSDPEIILFSQDEPVARKMGFTNTNKYEWEKRVDISEVAIIPVKDPIDLTRYLPLGD